MYTTQKTDISRINGLDLDALGNVVEQVADNPSQRSRASGSPLAGRGGL